jgi:hypothetical protein
MSEPKRISSPPVPCAVWLTVQFNGRTDSFSRRLFTERLSRFLVGTGIRPVVSTRLIGLHHTGGFSPFEISLITTWLSAQPEVRSHDLMPPVPSLLRKGPHHG